MIMKTVNHIITLRNAAAALLTTALLIFAQALHAQEDKFGIWTSAELEKKIAKGLDVSLEGEFRTRDVVKTVDRWSLGLQASYKLTKWLAVSAGYTFLDYYQPLEITNKGNYIPEYWQAKHRFQVSLTGKLKVDRFTFALRERWQYTYRPSQTTEKYDGDDGSQMDDEYIKGKGKNVLRSRLQIDYDIAKCKVNPFASWELYHSLHGDGLEKMRWSVGAEWKINKKNQLDIYYLYQNKADDDEADGSAVCIGYKFKF